MTQPFLVRSLTLLLLSGSALASPFSYVRYKFHQLVLRADSIVAGRITQVRDETYLFEVDDWIAGRPTASEIEVERFKDWTCHSRWTKYAKGQESVLFLVQAEPNTLSYRALGAGNEGEMPRVNGQVIAKGYRVQGRKSETIDIYGKELEGTRIPVDEFRVAVPRFRESIGLEKRYDEDRSWWRIKSLWARKDLEQAIEGLPLMRHLVSDAKSTGDWKERSPFEPVFRTNSYRKITSDGEGTLRTAGIGEALALDRCDEGFGRHVTALTDLDGDGITELAVCKGSYELSGRQRILFLDANGDVRRHVELGSKTALVHPAIEVVGDLNGDGKAEFLQAGPPEPNYTRQAWIGTLNAEGGVENVRFLEKEALDGSRLTGFGSGLAALGDLDGDGTHEVAISDEPVGRLDRTHGARVWIVSLDAEGQMTTVRSLKFDGEEDGRFSLGRALCAIGDVDGNGVVDLAVAHAHDDDGGRSRGAVWIVFLEEDGGSSHRIKISDWEGGFEGLLFDEVQFGRRLAAPGDLNGDGVPDLVVGDKKGAWSLLLTREGGVFDSTRIAPGLGGFTEDGQLDGSMLITRRADDGRPRLWMSGHLSEGLQRAGVLWLMELEAEGCVSPW